MRLARAFEERAVLLYRQGRLVGPLYTGIGHEAVSVGSAYALEEQDVIAPLHRDIGAHFVRGMTPREILAQYMGRAAGPTGGRDGNIHLGSLNRRIIPMISHLGAMIPTAAGIALASRLTGQPYVAMTYIGDGGSSTGDFHEGLNFASVRRLPLVVIVENNQFAYSTPTAKQFACRSLADRADGYGLPGVVVDGTDVIAVYEAAKHAVDRARSGEGPTLIEAQLMRMRGHSEADNSAYVPKTLLEEWAKKDPLIRYEGRLRSAGILTDQTKTDTDQRLDQEIEAAIKYAEESPWPQPGETGAGVYAEASGK
jgi:TPP-dependent pyruvate/acetoin dehydrogenase alpha subunit